MGWIGSTHYAACQPMCCMLKWRTLNGTPGTRSALVCSTQQMYASLTVYKLSYRRIVNISNLAAKHLLQLKGAACRQYRSTTLSCCSAL